MDKWASRQEFDLHERKEKNIKSSILLKLYLKDRRARQLDRGSVLVWPIAHLIGAIQTYSHLFVLFACCIVVDNYVKACC